MPLSASIPAIKQYIQAAEALGLDTAEILQRHNLSPRVMEDNTQRISLAQFEQIFLALIEATEHPFFGLYASNFINPSTYASLGLISIAANNLRECIELVPTYEPLVGDMGTTALRQQAEHTLQAWNCQIQHPLVRRHCIEAVLSSWFLYGRNMLGLEGELLAVQFEHPAPSKDHSPYTAVFGCQAIFNCTHNGLLLPTQALDTPLPQANPELQQSLISHADTLLQQLHNKGGFLHRVQAGLRQQMAEGDCSKSGLAEIMALSPRTLQRRLQEHGSSYHEQLNQLRYQQAKQLLTQNVDMDSISQQLGFAETRSFFRRFKQWSGITAGQYRRQNTPP